MYLTRTMGSGDDTGVTPRDYFDNHHYDMMVYPVSDRNRHNHRVVYLELYFYWILNKMKNILLLELHGLSPPRGVCDPSYCGVLDGSLYDGVREPKE